MTCERTWLDIGSEYTNEETGARQTITREIDGLRWKQVHDGLQLPLSPAMAIQECVKQLGLPKVSQVAHNGYLEWPDGPETAAFSIYGIEANYRNGRARVYVLDTGTECVPLASDFWGES